MLAIWEGFVFVITDLREYFEDMLPSTVLEKRVILDNILEQQGRHFLYKERNCVFLNQMLTEVHETWPVGNILRTDGVVFVPKVSAVSSRKLVVQHKTLRQVVSMTNNIPNLPSTKRCTEAFTSDKYNEAVKNMIRALATHPRMAILDLCSGQQGGVKKYDKFVSVVSVDINSTVIQNARKKFQMELYPAHFGVVADIRRPEPKNAP
jgi:hypothetical protein